MRTRIVSGMRRAAAIVSAGFVLQAGGCVTDSGELFAGLAVSVANSVISNFVFGAFGLVA